MHLWYRNSFIVASLTTITILITNALAAYVFARMRFKYKNLLFIVVLMTLVIPPEITIVPLFLGLSKFNIVDSYFSLMVPFLPNAFGVYLITQFFKTIPVELEEAAFLDGCGRAKILKDIFLPLSTPVLLTTTLFVFTTNWNSFLWPLIVTNSDQTRTLPVGLSSFVVGSGSLAANYGIIMSATVLASLFGVAIFLLFQKYFVQGIASSGLKG